MRRAVRLITNINHKQSPMTSPVFKKQSDLWSSWVTLAICQLAREFKTVPLSPPSSKFRALINCIRNHLARIFPGARSSSTCRDIFISVMFSAPLRFSRARKLISVQIKQFFINIEEILRGSARLIYETAECAKSTHVRAEVLVWKMENLLLSPLIFRLNCSDKLIEVQSDRGINNSTSLDKLPRSRKET